MGKTNFETKRMRLICFAIFFMSLQSAASELKNGYLGVSAKGYPFEMVRNELIGAWARVNLAGDGMILFSLTGNTDMTEIERILKSFTRVFSPNENVDEAILKLKDQRIVHRFMAERSCSGAEQIPITVDQDARAALPDVTNNTPTAETRSFSGNRLLAEKVMIMEKMIKEFRAAFASKENSR